MPLWSVCVSLVRPHGKSPLETRQQYPAIPWRDIIGMRNLLVHEYFRIDHDIVWQTVTVELPALVHALEERQA